MFDWKEMKVQASDKKKAQVWQQIEQKVNQKTPNYIPSLITAAMLFIVALLWISWSPADSSDSASDMSVIEKIYVQGDRGEPTSKWQIGVKEIKDQALLAQYDQLLMNMYETEPRQLIKEVAYSINIIYQDGQNRHLYIYDYAAGFFVKDVKTGVMYTTEQSVDELLSATILTLYDRGGSAWLIVIIIVLLVIQTAAEKKLNPKDENGYKQPAHSHPSQTVVDIVMIITVFGLLMADLHINIWWLEGMIALAVWIKIMIETQTENASWRKMLFVTNVLYISVWLLVLSQYFI